MAATNKTLVFSTASRGFHVHRDVWNLHENEELMCLFEANNLFDMFAIRICRKDCEKKVGHLPTEISRPTKYPRGEKIIAKLWSIHYRRSPLFQEGLEIPCGVTLTISASIKGHLLMQRYEKMVHELYCEPQNETTMDSFIENINVDCDTQPKKKKKKDTGKSVRKPKKSKDIRYFFQKP